MSNENRKESYCSEEFIAAMSHDLRLPLAIIKESVNLIIDGIPGSINEKQKKMLIIARKNVDKMVIIMDALLEKANKANAGGDSDVEENTQK
ncbi:MAG: histidine kinase dimerization/phospho-acceptor domain-containing protein [Candidatus Omnitrophota bacterium]